MKRFSILLLLTIAASCAEHIDSGESSRPESDVIETFAARAEDFVHIYDQQMTKTEFISDKSGNYQSVWSENDSIGIFPSKGSQIFAVMSSGTGSRKALFDGDGWALKSEETYCAYFPLIGDFYLDRTKLPVDFSIQTQKGNGSTEEISSVDFLYANGLSADADGDMSFTFKHLSSIVHFRISVPKAGNYVTAFLHTPATVAVKGTFDLGNGHFTASESASYQILKLENVSVNSSGGYLDLFFAMCPQNLSGGKLNLKLFHSDGTVYSVDINGFTLQSGNFYHIKRTAVVDNAWTGIPVVFVDTPCKQSAINKNDWVSSSSVTILKTDGTVDFSGGASIKGRGNASWDYKKKPYAIKLDSKSKILDMPKHKRWCLLANWKDRTLLRNAAAFWLSEHTQSLKYTPKGQFVELYFNGEHRGNYYLCEQIRVDKNRVNIAEEGGYLMEIDAYWDETYKWKSPSFNLPYQLKSPDENVSDSDFNSIKNYVAEMEACIKTSSSKTVPDPEYKDYMDIETAIDFLFVNELATNTDFYNSYPISAPHSFYLYKDVNGKICFGPVWDFDYHGFMPSLANQWAGLDKTGLYYAHLLKDPDFKARVKEKWNAEKNTFKSLPNYIDEMARLIEKSESVNHNMWPISPVPMDGNKDENKSWSEAVSLIKQGFLKKWEWMDTQIQGM